MPPKKKKTQLKPVARGFATTSQPKKVQEVQPESSSSQLGDVSAIKKDQEIKPTSATSGVVDKSDLLDADNQSLQSLVDKLQDRTEKEITRQAIEADKRFAQTLPRLDIEPALRDRVLEMVLNSEAKATKLDENDDKALARLGITYGVLRRLGFDEDIVERCLRSTNGIDLEDAFDWLFLNCSEFELDVGHPDKQKSKALKLSGGVSVRKNYTPPPTPRFQLEHLSPLKAPEPRPSNLTSSKISIQGEPPSVAQIMAEYDKGSELLSLDDSSLDPGDPTVAFVRLKLLHDVVSSKSRSSTTTEQLRVLRKEMDTLSKDYLFDEKGSKGLYSREKGQLQKKLLQERLLAPPSATDPQSAGSDGRTEKSKPPKAAPQSEDTVLSNASDSDDSSTGMLGILDDPDATEITVKGVTFNLRTMALPKQWSGPMPKTLLRDFVAKQDRYAAISYSMLSMHSRARRACVSISWQSKRRDEWSMEDVACPEDSQADNYIATVALHSLTYPEANGFASSTPASSSSSTSFRLLPVVYRELWDELEAARKLNEDDLNRQTWAKLRAILDDKAQFKKVSEKQTKQAADKQISTLPSSISNDINLSDPMALAFQARQSSPAFQSILAQRHDLPISQYRNDITTMLNDSQVLVLSGETGCGKSTQVPSFILEDHILKGKHCKIICTEPRRISAISLAQRVGYELCDPPNSAGNIGSLVGYSIRLESNISRSTRLAFVTNGIALRMLENGSGQGGQGTAFDEITHIIVDEVHERTIESDFLLIVLKTLMLERPDLKVVLMSATLDAEKISAYFGGCPTLHVPGRTFPVTIQYLEDAIEYTKWSISETSPYARRLSDKFYRGKNRPEWSEEMQTVDDDEADGPDMQGTNVKLEKRYSPDTAGTLNTIDERLILYDLIIRLLERICYEDQGYHPFSAAVLIFMPGLGEIRRMNDALVEHPKFGSNDFKLYPLHSTLSSESQGAVFDLPPPGVRKIVIATNIAETGITIPDITCVIDTGKHREMRFDEKRQISRLVETFVAKSNAAQRRGRAGRVRNGLCFHLFTKLRHDTQMADAPLPEMMRLSLSDLALRIKIMNVKLGTSIGDVLSRAMDPPIAVNVQRAISMLVEVRALTPSEDITPMGRLLSKLPTDVHLGKFLLIATLFGCLDPALTIAATLNSKSPFVAPLGLEHDADRAKASFRIENSDFLTIHNAFASWRRACANPGFARKFCRNNFLSHQNLQQIEDLRQQFLGYLTDSSFIQADKGLLRELSRARYGRNKTRFVTVPAELDVNSSNPILVHAALTAGLYPKILSINSNNGEMRTITNNQHAYFHPSSINFGKNPLDFGVNHLAYFTLMHSKKLYAWETGPVDDLSLLLLCGDAEHKVMADTISIDRKTRFCVPPKTNLALKVLREQLASLMAQQYQGKPLGEAQSAWKEVGLLALSRVKIKQDNDDVLLTKAQ